MHLQIRYERVKFVERDGLGRRAHPFTMFLHRQLPVSERGIQELARPVAIVVGRPNVRGGHGDDLMAAFRSARQIPLPEIRCENVVLVDVGSAEAYAGLRTADDETLVEDRGGFTLSL